MTSDPARDLSPATAHYNIGRYYWSINDSARAAFRGTRLRVGDRAPAFALTSVDGDVVTLTDLLSSGHVVLVFGCWSAPPAVIELPALERLRSVSDANCTWVFVYTREIHPSEETANGQPAIPAHQTFEAKLAIARRFKDRFELSMMVCADDLEGTVHLMYGGLPSFQLVIHRDGSIVHLAEWISAGQLEGVLSNLTFRDARSRAGRPLLAYSETIWCCDFLTEH